MLTNSQLAELLAREAEAKSGILSRAYRRAARSAFLWPEEATDLISEHRSLTELRAIGPFISKRILRWIDKPPVKKTRPPAIRRDFIALADARVLLAKNPQWSKNVRGDLQMHSRYSDGSGTIAEMAEAARARHYEYIAITDHSKGLKIAGGIDEKRLSKQATEIGRINKSQPGLMVLASIELNLNPRGEGDMDPKALAKLDVVLGSFHSVLRVKHDQTKRYLAALRNPDIQILGHPRGRIYNYRLGLKADWSRVFAEAAKLDKAVEIDCYPDRQDLNLSLLKLARREGTRISLGTDAHRPWQLEFIELGLAAALKAKIPAGRIINFLALDEFRKWVARVRTRGRR
ncbi:MAG TPA: PHP domain-containing protein [Chthoniobacterales bacterium]|nr:PHP domain-containing protein [Chthoniobacterales bacterium]